MLLPANKITCKTQSSVLVLGVSYHAHGTNVARGFGQGHLGSKGLTKRRAKMYVAECRISRPWDISAGDVELLL